MAESGGIRLLGGMGEDSGDEESQKMRLERDTAILVKRLLLTLPSKPPEFNSSAGHQLLGGPWWPWAQAVAAV